MPSAWQLMRSLHVIKLDRVADMLKSKRTALSLLALIILSTLAASCGRGGKADLLPSREEYSVMSFNLQHYSLEDRDQDRQRNDPKPLEERRAVVDIIARAQPDILIVQEIGCPNVFEDMVARIESAGIEYRHKEYLRASPHDNNMALLTSFPILSRQSHTNDTYSIGGKELKVARGIIDVELDIGAGETIRVMAAHLKSKVYHPLGQTEMRRNEARILGQYVARILKQSPECKLLVAGDFNDHPNSAALREINGGELLDIRPLDTFQTAWTQRREGIDVYQRIDYLLVSRQMAGRLVRSKTRIIDSKAAMQASDHRPLIAVFQRR